MKNEEDKDITCKKIAWTIRHFATLKTNDRHCSEVFTVGHCAWRLIIYRGRTDTKNSLALYLEAADASNLPQGWSILAAFSLTIVNQVSMKESLTKGGADASVPDTFCADSCSWGYKMFIPLSELEDPSRGYISSDKCIVEVEFFSVTFEGIPTSLLTYPSLSKDVCSKDDDFVDFKDLGQIEKALVPLLEEVCSWHPLLIDCTRKRSRKFTEWAFTCLGRVLEILKDKKWKDMNEESCDQLQILWEELKMSNLDLNWLEPRVKYALNMKGYMEKTMKVNNLKQELVVLETKLNKLKENMANTEQSIETTRKELIKAEEGFEEINDLDLNIEIGYGNPIPMYGLCDKW